jgi:hypothetical protein
LTTLFGAIAEQPNEATLLVQTAKDLMGEVGDVSTVEAQLVQMKSLSSIYQAIAKQPEMADFFKNTAKELMGEVGDTSSSVLQAARMDNLNTIYGAIVLNPTAAPLLIETANEMTGQMGDTSGNEVQVARLASLASMFVAMEQQPGATDTLIQAAKELTGDVANLDSIDVQEARLESLSLIYKAIVNQLDRSEDIYSAAVELFGAPNVDGICLSQTQPVQFPNQYTGYSAVTGYPVSINRISRNINQLKVQLSGVNPDAFEISALDATSLMDDQSTATFTVKPKLGLGVGTYSANVTVTAAGVIAKRFTIHFSVGQTPIEPPVEQGPIYHDPIVPVPAVPMLPVGMTKGGKIDSQMQNAIALQDEDSVARFIFQKEPSLKAVEALASRESLVIEMEEAVNKRVEVEVPGLTMMRLGEKEGFLSVQIGHLGFQLPATGLGLGELLLKENMNASDVTFVLEMEKAPDSNGVSGSEVAAQRGATVVSDLYSFKWMLKMKDKVVELPMLQQKMARQTIPYTSPLVDAKKAVVVLIENGKMFPVPTVFADGKAHFYSQRMGTYMIVGGTKIFDDIQTHWAKESIEVLANKWIVNGTTPKTFRPNAIMTRAEFAAILVRALGLEPGSVENKGTFTDIDSNAWYSLAVLKATESGILFGVDEHRFAPNAPITREEMIVAMIRASEKFGLPLRGDVLPNGLHGLNEGSPESQSAIEKAIRAGILLGKPDGNIALKENGTRSQAAVIVRRFLDSVY